MAWYNSLKDLTGDVSKGAQAVGSGVKTVGHAIGDAQNNKWVKAAEAAGLAATGIGAPEAALLMGGAGLVGGAIRSGGGLKGAITEGGQGALTGAAAGLAGSGIRQIGSKIASMGAQKMLPGATSGGATIPGTDIPVPDGGTTASGPGLGGALSSVGSALLPKNADGSINWAKAAQLGLTVGAGVEGIQNSNKASALQKQALDAATGDYNLRAPLRTAAYAALANPVKANDSNLFDPTNPYARKPLPVVGTQQPTAGGY